jgi:hypothetical protein
VSNVNLPAIIPARTPTLASITEALGVPREVLASDEEIGRAWGELPRLISAIPGQVRSELHVRMCVAVATGLFDSAINYAWNSAIVELRARVRAFGLNVVGQIRQTPFDEAALLDLKDAELLKLCLDLNLLSEDAFFFLDQSRDVRNNFSSAHPAVGKLDADEFIVFLSRCARYALTASSNPKGVDMPALIGAIKGSKFAPPQLSEWIERIGATHDAQRDSIFSTLHGIYCDPNSVEETRINSLSVSEAFALRFSPTAKSNLINRHSDYVAGGLKDRQTASQLFFEKLGLLSLLSQAERHTIISNAARRLMAAHQGWDNFYNEPPFAERLRELSVQTAIPESAQAEFVTTVMACAVGNPYGISHAAYPHYKTMIRNFSPKEIAIMLDLPSGSSVVGLRVKQSTGCKARYKDLVASLDEKSVPTSHRGLYDDWNAI